MDGVDVDDRLVRAERIAQVLVRVDELLLGFHVDLARHGFRLLPVEADAVHQLDQSRAGVVQSEPLQDELSDFGGRRRQHPRRPGAQFVDLEGRQRTGAAVQIEQDERLDATVLECLEPGADGGVVDVERLGDLGEGPALVEQQHRVRPAGDAMLLQPVPGDLHQVGPVRCTEETTVHLHQATGIDPADSVKRFSDVRGIPLYFSWRQAAFAQEQMHAGLNLPDRSDSSPGGREAAAAVRDLLKLGDLPPSDRAPVALVFDYEADWVCKIQPHGASFNYVELALRWYEAARRLGLDIDILRPGDSLNGYALVLAPSLPIVSEATEAAFAAADGVAVFGPRSGSKTRQFSIPDGLPPGPLRSLIPMRVIEVASTRPGVRKSVSGEISGGSERWLEHIETDARVLARFADGWPALVAEGRSHYLGLWPDPAALSSLMSCVARKAGLSTVALPEGVRLRRRGDLVFAFNYGVEPWPAPFAAAPILGDAVVAPRSYSVWPTSA